MCEQNCFAFRSSAVCKLCSTKKEKGEKKEKNPFYSWVWSTTQKSTGEKNLISIQARSHSKFRSFLSVLKVWYHIKTLWSKDAVKFSSFVICRKNWGKSNFRKRTNFSTINSIIYVSRLHCLEQTASITQKKYFECITTPHKRVLPQPQL